MTCVLTSPLHVGGTGYESPQTSWYQGMHFGLQNGAGMMDPSSSSSQQQQEQREQQRQQHHHQHPQQQQMQQQQQYAQHSQQQMHEYASSVESSEEPRRNSSTSGKKRASRAGTRSVSSLSATQLERKRANDREAQRAIRKRTKEHISSLEQDKSELMSARDASDQMLAVTRQRVRELEDENSYLRNRLTDAGFPTPNVPHRINTQQRLSDPAVVPIVTSPSQHASSMGRSDSTALSVANSHSSSSRHGSWPQQQQQSQSQQLSSFVGAGGAAAGGSAGAPTIPVGANLTQWTSHDSSTHSMHSQPSPHQQLQEAVVPGSSYSTTATPTERSPWTAPQQAQQQGYSYPQDTQRAQQQFTSSAYAAGPRQAGQPGAAPPQAEFSALHVSSPTGYQMPGAAAAAAATSYPMGVLGMSPDASSDYAAAAAAANAVAAVQQGQMQPPPIPGAAGHYHHGPAGQQQGYMPPQQQQQQAPQQPPAPHQQMQFRDPSGNRTYAMPSYSSG